MSTNKETTASGGDSIVTVFAWIVSIAVCNLVGLIAAAFGVFIAFVAGYAIPSVGAFFSRTEVVPLLEEQIDKYLPGILSKYRDPDVARTVLTTAIVVLVICVVLVVIGCIRVFLKADVNPIFLIIPIVNLYKLCSIANGGFLMFLGMLLPGVQLVAAVALCIGLSRAFGRSAFYAVPLLFLPPLFLNLLTVNRDYVE